MNDSDRNNDSKQQETRAFAERERIYKGRFKELREEVMVGVEASKRGEVVDSETVFKQLEQKLLLRL